MVVTEFCKQTRGQMGGGRDPFGGLSRRRSRRPKFLLSFGDNGTIWKSSLPDHGLNSRQKLMPMLAGTTTHLTKPSFETEQVTLVQLVVPMVPELKSLP